MSELIFVIDTMCSWCCGLRTKGQMPWNTQNKKDFLDFHHSNREELLMQHEFSKGRSMGANSFPSVVKDR